MFNKLNNVEVFIKTTNGATKHETKFTLPEASELERIIILQNLFKVMGADGQLSDMIEDFSKLGKAYNSFFSTIQEATTEAAPLEPQASSIPKAEIVPENVQDEPIQEPEPSKKPENNSFAAAMQQAFQEPDAAAINAAVEDTSIPKHYVTGIMETPQGNKYQCRLICVKCRLKKTHYISSNTSVIYCKQCNESHKVRNATSVKFKPDTMNNYFIAGDFVGQDEVFSKR